MLALQSVQEVLLPIRKKENGRTLLASTGSASDSVHVLFCTAGQADLCTTGDQQTASEGVSHFAMS